MEQAKGRDFRISVENVGGIDRTSITFSPGVTVLAGRNATNRTSCLQAIMAGCGSESVSLKAGADEGSVELSLNGDTYTRTLSRVGDNVSFGGEPYLEDPTTADLFAFLLESNEARRAVARGDELRELIMRPVDTAAIRDDIDQLQSEKRDVKQELDRLDELRHTLPSLEERQRDLTTKIEEKREELATIEAEIAEFDGKVPDEKEIKLELESKLETLRETRSDLEDVRFKLDTQRESLQDLREERDELEDTLETIPDNPAEELATVEDRIDRLRDRKAALDAEITELQNVIQFNREKLEDEGLELLGAHTDGGRESVTDRLVRDAQVVCWTCGTEVAKDGIEDTIEELREVQEEKLASVEKLEAEIEDLRSERTELRDHQRSRERIKRRRREVEDEIQRRERTVAELEDRRKTLTEEIDGLEAEVEALQGEAEERIIERHREANEIEFELGQLERELDDVESEIENTKEQLDEEENLESRLETLRERLTERRTRIEHLEEEAANQFNEHMERVLDRLGYRNLERVWLERIETKSETGSFSLHIVRKIDEGTTFEDTVDHLSESEREVVGLIFALAGYLVHEVHEECPIILLDSLEALDSSRIASLLEYLQEFADYLIVALLPADANAVNDEYNIISDV